MVEPEFDHLEWSFDHATGVGRIVIDRPTRLNTFTAQTRAELTSAFHAFERVDAESTDGLAVRAVILDAAGDEAFSAGADVDEFGEGPPRLTPIRLYDTVERFGAPVVAQIDGYCFGGGLELALTCDFRLASERSEFGQTEVAFGLPPGGGATQRLPDLVGLSRAKELCMTGERFSAERAVADGVVDHAYPAADLDNEVTAFVDRLISQAPMAVRAVKHLTNVSREVDVREGHAMEWLYFHLLQHTEDFREGAAAFEDGRDPNWEGR